MKLNKITMMLAAAALASCSSDLNEQFTAQAPQDSRLMELDANFMIAGVADEGATTRTHWEWNEEKTSLVNKFLPTYSSNVTADNKLSQHVIAKDYEKVGLCWYQGGAEVYTNYEFYHYGWLANDETEVKASCGEVFNGALYSEIPMTTGSEGNEANPETDFKVASFPAKALKDGDDNLNYNSGIYKTDNKAIFEGDYIVYYPYNEDFKERGTIPATAETVMKNRITDLNDPALGKATFRYSDVTSIDGGAQAAGFKMNNLSTLVQLRVAGAIGDGIVGKKIDQVVLYSPNKQLIAQANLDASKIAAGNKADLYASTVGTNAIVVNETSGFTVIQTNLSTVESSYLTVLPTTVDDLWVLVHKSDDGTWARKYIGKKEFKAGGAVKVQVDLKLTDFNYEYIAVDETSLTTALTAARLVATKTNPVTIAVLGDIELESDLDINEIADEFITIDGCDIIVPQDVTLTVNTNMVSDIRVLGKDCCTPLVKGGALVVEGGLISNVTMEPTEAYIREETSDYDDYNPTLTYAKSKTDENITVAAGKTIEVQAGNVYVGDPTVMKTAIVDHKGDLVVREGAKVTVNADQAATPPALPSWKGGLKFLGSNVDNYGTIEVMKNGDYDMKSSTDTTTGSVGQNMTNHPTGKFIHNVDAAVGTTVQNMKQQGEYRCRVDQQTKLDDAYIKWKACNVIEMVNRTTAQDEEYDLMNVCKHNFNGGQVDVDIEVNNTGKKVTFTNPTPDANPITIGNLTVKSELDVVYTNTVGTLTKSRTLIVNGDMDVQDDATLTSSSSVKVNKNLTIKNAAAFTYAAANGGLEVIKDITVDENSSFTVSPKALNVKCANFLLKNKSTATFGNRKKGTGETMIVANTISNPKDCTFDITPANTDDVSDDATPVYNGLLAYITCKTLVDGGAFPGGEPIVE